MFSSLFDTLGGLLRPLLFGLLILIGIGFLTGGSGARGSDGFGCRGITNNADLNRTLCAISPARIWNTPIVDLIPGLKGE